MPCDILHVKLFTRELNVEHMMIIYIFIDWNHVQSWNSYLQITKWYSVYFLEENFKHLPDFKSTTWFFIGYIVRSAWSLFSSSDSNFEIL